MGAALQRQRKHGWQELFEFEERLASVRGPAAVNVNLGGL